MKLLYNVCFFVFIIIFPLPNFAQKDIPDYPNDLYPPELIIFQQVYLTDKENSTLFFSESGTDALEHILYQIEKDNIQAYAPPIVEGFFPYTVFNRNQTTLDFEDIAWRLFGEQEKKVTVNMCREPVKSLLFVENWHFDKNTARLEKRVKAILPVWHYPDKRESPPRQAKKIAFQIQYKEKGKIAAWFAKRRRTHFATIHYEFFMHHEPDKIPASCRQCTEQNYSLEKQYNPFWSSYSRKIFIKTLIDKALSAEIEAFNYDTEDKVSLTSLKEKVGIKKERFEYADELGNLTVKYIENEPDYESIRSVIFIENWLIDPKTYQIYKDITGIAPVRYSDSKRDILFILKNQ